MHWHRVLLVEHLLLLLELIAEALVATAHHAWMRSEIVGAAAHRWALAVVHASTSLRLLLLHHRAGHALAATELLLRLLRLIVLLRPVPLYNANVVSLERVLHSVVVAHEADAAWALHDRLVHINAHIWVVETAQILEILNLTLKHGEIVCKHLPVELLSDILLAFVLLVLLLPRIVYVAVEEDELVPLLQVLAHVIDVLLADFEEVLSTGEVIEHDDAADFVEQLLLEVLALVEQLLDLLSALREH